MPKEISVNVAIFLSTPFLENRGEGGDEEGRWVNHTLGVRFDDTCTVSGKRNVSKVIPRLYGSVYKTLRLSSLLVEHSVVLWL